MLGGGHDHDTFPAFMHSTENTTGVGACVHAQYWRMTRHSRTIETHTPLATRTLYVFSLLADFGRFWEIRGDFCCCLGWFAPDRYPDTFVSNCINE